MILNKTGFFEIINIEMGLDVRDQSHYFSKVSVFEKKLTDKIKTDFLVMEHIVGMKMNV